MVSEKRIIMLVMACAALTLLVPVLIAVTIRSPSHGTKQEIVIPLFDHASGRVIRIPLEDYLIGVVAAEMPASFEMEALRAQAVAARTYTLKKLASSESSIAHAHPQGKLCTDPGCCQAWDSREDLVRKWGSSDYVPNILKIMQAVTSTQGLVLTYNGALIDAVYHSCCGGATEDASEVWGRFSPYLVSVGCVCAERGYVQGETRPVRSQDLLDLLSALGLEGNARAVPALSRGVQVVSTTATRRARTVSVYGVSVPAVDVRRALSLKSTRLSIRSEPGMVYFTTTGYGHGVGMCQWGASVFASMGWDFSRILTHYYRGTQIKHIYTAASGE